MRRFARAVTRAPRLAGSENRPYVTYALPAPRLDGRIGPHAYLRPGLGIAGGNLERNFATLQKMAAKHGTDETVILVAGEQRLSAAVGLNGLNTEGYATITTRNSPLLELIRTLKGRRIRADEPAAEVGFIRCREPAQAASGIALVVVTPWALYGDVRTTEALGRTNGRLVLGPSARLNEEEYRSAGLDHRLVGC